MTTTSAAHKRATIKYAKSAYHRIPLDVKHVDYDRIQAAANAANESVNGYIKKAINMRIESESDSCSEEQ